MYLPTLYELPSYLSELSTLQFSRPSSIWIDTLTPAPKTDSGYKILLLVEPNSILNLTQKTIKLAHHFDTILTFDAKILEHVPHAIRVEFGSSWITEPTPPKEFETSVVVGFKRQTEGHRLRHELLNLYPKIQTPTSFYLSNRGTSWYWELKKLFLKKLPVLGDSKIHLFKSMFHIAIENSQEPYYFSEKLIDCLVTNTVPLYWGATRIEEYFNPNGIIRFNTLKELIEILNKLTPEDYLHRKEAIEENARLAIPYINYTERIIDIVTKILNKTD